MAKGNDPKKKGTSRAKRIDITSKMSAKEKKDFKIRHKIDLRKTKSGNLVGTGQKGD